MSKTQMFPVAVAITMSVFPLPGAPFAETIIQYDPGVGSTATLNNPAAALGEPSRMTSGPFGGPVDPFNPPFLGSQIVSLGAGGSLTVRFSEPILNRTENPFGLDFIVFGNAGFVITNDFDPGTFTFVGTPATDGSLFGANNGTTRVSVSEDGVQFFTLDPARAPGVDQLFPTDGLGDFQRPVNPALLASDFAGSTLEDIRTRYGGAAGGAGFDLAWALNDQGQSAGLARASYVRIDGLSDKAEIDGIVSVPEPPVWSLAALAMVCAAVGAVRGGRRHRNPAQ